MADEQEIKDLKIKRRTAKARVTRLSNALQNLLDSERDLEEVTELFQDLDVAYQQLEVKHERYCEVIDDDEAFLKEDEWLAECQASFLDMRKRVKDYGKAKDDSERQIETSVVNTETNPQEETAVRSEEVSSCKVQVERPKLPRFTGDVRDYTTFKSDFKHLIESRYSKRDAITILRSSLVGKPLDLIRGLGNDYDAAWAHLDNIYGDPRQVADAIVYDLGKFRPLKEGEDGRFCDFVHLIRRSYNSLQEVGRVNDMDNNHMISLIERKLSSDDRKLWLRFLDRERADASFHALLYWLDMELKTRIRASAPLRDSRSATVSHLSMDENSGERKPDFKCWLCESSDHWVDQCKKVLSKSQEERFKLMKDNRACFSCLKRAGKDHNMKTCKRRKRCNERDTAGEQCTSFHHPLLHRQIQSGSVDIAGVTGTSSLLPVVKIKMMGPKSGNCQGNCILDSGAQMSLVRKAVAEELGLKGRPIVVNVTKVGGDAEEYSTMLYKMRVQGLGSGQSYSVSAVGLDVINDNIAEVHVDELAHVFSLRKEDVNREGGSIDLLIGIDHPRMHVGQTKIQGNLVARHAPLGWVIFGKIADDFSEGAVLHITLNRPADVRDFSTTEGMGVCHDRRRCQANKMTKQRAMETLQATDRERSKNPEYAEADDKHIPGDANVADEFSRGLSPDQLNGRCSQGPDFLCQPKTEWPAEAKPEEKLPEVEREVRKKRSVLTTSKAEDIDCKQFSHWRRLVRVISYVLKFIRKLKSKCKRSTGEDNEVIDSNLTPTDMQKGEVCLKKCAQISLKSRVDKGELEASSPYTDEVGLKVGRRVERAGMPFAKRRQALLPDYHWKSTLMTRLVHENSHHGVASTTAKTRRKYWILKEHNLAKTIRFRCTTCRAYAHRLESQEMAKLPRESLQPYSPPFHSKACDHCSPFTVKTTLPRNTDRRNVHVDDIDMMTDSNSMRGNGQSRLSYKCIQDKTVKCAT